MAKCDTCNNQFCKNLTPEHQEVYRRNCSNMDNSYYISSDGYSERVYQKECPFCHSMAVNLKGCNLFCRCNAKYYYYDKVWLDRNTGKTVKEEL